MDQAGPLEEEETTGGWLAGPSGSGLIRARPAVGRSQRQLVNGPFPDWVGRAWGGRYVGERTIEGGASHEKGLKAVGQLALTLNGVEEEVAIRG